MRKHVVGILVAFIAVMVFHCLILGQERVVEDLSTPLGFAVLILGSLVVSVLVYWMFYAMIHDMANQKVVRGQQALVPFPTKILTLCHPLDGSPMVRFQCNKDGCDGYLAAPSDGREVFVFCLKCQRRLDKPEVAKIVDKLPGAIAFL
ncbi:MAG: hypothetical protein A3I29_04385 [Candidatus Magasanikbacteria bacterium RIFCSPLOWO2_02_FULL_44_11]|uniref:Uncharacterized protein n=2 Tax=Candidatus Magasanikiibacteriota TaxID=1752731 RepID=A0A1F6NB65_9BACT|nr:MAG: hypothetical protein A3D53_01070 [Candidatus Magasanikbacteria bacterium RIFCSPHIGHO2_02_FULL_45_10]OGH81176.1 MAG: hypothetical protein A3I29_04385 [Candidatus Magasanikbacteria bacterium RIFCSPLOWO2_02_FULL_44_11]